MLLSGYSEVRLISSCQRRFSRARNAITMHSILVLQRCDSQVAVIKLDVFCHLVIGSRYHSGSRMAWMESNNGTQFLFSLTSDFQKNLPCLFSVLPNFHRCVRANKTILLLKERKLTGNLISVLFYNLRYVNLSYMSGVWDLLQSIQYPIIMRSYAAVRR